MTGTRPRPGCWTTTSTLPPAPTLSSPARPAPPQRTARYRPRFLSWPTGSRRWARAGSLPRAAGGRARPGPGPDRASLFACLDRATGTGQHPRVIAFTAALAGLLRRDGPWADAIIRHTAAT